MDELIKFTDSVVNFFKDFWSFISDYIYQMFVWIYAGLVETSTLAFLKFALIASDFAWSVANQILLHLDFKTFLANSWGYLSPDAQFVLSECQIPQCVSIISTAYVSKFVMRFIPFMK